MNKPRGKSRPVQRLAYATMRQASSNNPGYNLHLTVRFGEDRYHWKSAGVKLLDLYVGVRGAFLNFSLMNCTMPDDAWVIDPPVEQMRPIRRTTEQSQAKAQAGRTSLTSGVRGKVSTSGERIEVGAEVDTTRSVEAQNEVQVGAGVYDEFARTLYFITARGGPDAPSWFISSAPDEPILRGAVFKDQRFCRVVPTAANAEITVEMEIATDDLVIRDQTGLLSSPNKFGLARWLLSREYCRNSTHIASLMLTQDTHNDD